MSWLNPLPCFSPMVKRGTGCGSCSLSQLATDDFKVFALSPQAPSAPFCNWMCQWIRAELGIGCVWNTHILTGCSHHSSLRRRSHEALDWWTPLNKFLVRAEGVLLPVINESAKCNIENHQSLHVGWGQRFDFVLVLHQHDTVVIFRDQVSDRVSKAYEPANAPTFTNIRVNTVEGWISDKGHVPISYLQHLCHPILKRCIFLFEHSNMPLQGSTSLNAWRWTQRHSGGGRLAGFHPKCCVYKSVAHRWSGAVICANQGFGTELRAQSQHHDWFPYTEVLEMCILCIYCKTYGQAFLWGCNPTLLDKPPWH